MFKKRRNANIRERVTVFDDEEDEDTEILQPMAPPPLTVHKKKSKKNKTQKAAINTLSFEDELQG